jgi:hypothetical protein
MVENKTMSEIGAQIENARNIEPTTNRPGLNMPKKITDAIECYDKGIDLRELIKKISPKSFVIEGDNSYFVITI